MMAMRKTLVEAKSQHLPEDAWFVIGEPSVGILMLKFWVSEMIAEREESTAFAELELRAARARRFYSYQRLKRMERWLLNYLRVFHELFLPFRYRCHGDVWLVLCSRGILGCCMLN
jgi:hypothetical protein